MKVFRYFLLFFALLTIASCGEDHEIQPSGQDERKPDVATMVSGISLNKNAVTLFKEDTYSLVPDVAPAAAENKAVYWSSSAPNIASVDDRGVVTAHSEGEATITVLTADQSKFAHCKVTVKGLYSVLFIGNSYTQEGIETQFLNILNKTDIRHKVRVTWMHKFGMTIKGHGDAYTTDKTYYRHRYAPGASAWTKETNEVTLQDVVKSAEFDLIVLQENPVSQEGWMWNNTRKSEVEGLMNKIKADQKNTPKFACMMGQAYADPVKVQAGYNVAARNILVSNFGGKQTNMYIAIVGHTQAMATAMSMDVVIPWGTTLQNLRTASLNSTHKMDMTTNGVFADLGVGRFAAACTVFESIFTPVFGVNLDGIDYVDNSALSQDTGSGKYKTGVTAETAVIALKAARLAIQKPYQMTVMVD